MSCTKLGCCLLAGVVVFSSDTKADSAEDKSGLFQMSLEQLLSISVVSKKAERLVDTPGVVTSYDADQLRSLGLSSLRDFLHFIPGLEINARLNPPSLVQIRGTPATSNQKVLFMLNGVPYWMPDNGEFPLYGIPFNAIERLEVIRGPGSVVYGTNASAGVINVITRKDYQTDVLVQGNTDAALDSTLFAGGRLDNDVRYQLSVGARRGGDYNYQVDDAFALDFSQTADGKLEKSIEYESFLGSFQFRGLELMLQSFESRETGDANGSIVSPSEYEARGTLVGLKYTQDFDDTSIELHSSWNRYYREIYVDGSLKFFGVDEPARFSFDHSGKGNTRFRNGLSLTYRLSDESKLMFGAEYEERGTENKVFRDTVGGDVLTSINTPPFSFIQLREDGAWLLVEEGQAYESSAYLQVDHDLDDVRLVLGGRYVSNNLAGSEFSPRGSIVYTLDNSQSLKVLYSEGFNSPTFSQSSATNSQGVPLDNDVSAETIQTWDLAYTYSDATSHHVLSFFHTEIEDLITSNSNADERIKRRGMEYEFQYRSDNWQAISGFSYIHDGDGKGDDDAAEFASKWLLKAGLGYDWGKQQLSASLRSAGKRQNVGMYNLLNAHYSAQVSNKLKVSLTLENLLDDRGETPEVRDGRDLVIESNSGFTVAFGINYRLGLGQ